MFSIIVALLCCVLGIGIGFVVRWIYAKSKLTSAEQQAVRIAKEIEDKANADAKELMLETREALQKEQQQSERDARERRLELQKNERRLLQKEMNLEHKQNELDAVKKQLGERENSVSEREKAIEEKEAELVSELERVASMSREEAKSLIIVDKCPCKSMPACLSL